eukprot:COSAG02_NODE_30301_length_553_cov_38.196035_1_plen_86_part_00
MKNTSCSNEHFGELEYSLPVIVGLQDVLRTLELGESLRPQSFAHGLLEDCFALLGDRAGKQLRVAPEQCRGSRGSGTGVEDPSHW